MTTYKYSDRTKALLEMLGLNPLIEMQNLEEIARQVELFEPILKLAEACEKCMAPEIKTETTSGTCPCGETRENSQVETMEFGEMRAFMDKILEKWMVSTESSPSLVDTLSDLAPEVKKRLVHVDLADKESVATWQYLVRLPSGEFVRMGCPEWTGKMAQEEAFKERDARQREKEVDDLKVEILKEVRDEIDKVSQENEALKAMLFESHSTLAAGRHGANVALEQSNRVLKANCRAFEAENKELKTKVDKLERLCNNKEAKIESLQKANDTQYERLKAVIAAVSGKPGQIN